MTVKNVLIGFILLVWIIANMSVGFDKKDAISMMNARLPWHWHLAAFAAIALILFFVK